MSQPNLGEDEFVPAIDEGANVEVEEVQLTQKRQLNVYTMMLILSFLAIVVSCLLLFMELRRWGDFPWWNADPSSSTSQVVPADAWSGEGVSSRLV